MSTPNRSDLGDGHPARPVDDTLADGAFVDGRYRVLRRLGEGVFGSVYLAEHVHIRRRVALKQLQARHVADEHARARFLREAQAAAALDHPAIVRVLDFGETERGGPYLVVD